MAGVTKTKGAASWVAVWRNDAGRVVKKSTFVLISQAGTGKTEKQTRREAEEVATAYEEVAKGRILYSVQEDIFRAKAGVTADEQKALGKRLDVLRELGSAAGCARRMPTVREYFTEFQPSGKEQNVSNAKRSLSLFLTHLGRAADMRLDRLTREHIQGFVEAQAGRVRCTTVGQYRTHISTALNAAVDAGLLVRNPAHGVKMPRETEDPIRRDAFTPEEICKIYHGVPQEWKDAVLICVSMAGQRIGDCMRLRWQAVDLAAGVIRFRTSKASMWMEFPLMDPLKSRLEELWATRAPGEEYVMPYMARRYERSKGILSCEFVRRIEACGISTVLTGSTKGDRRQVHNKTFHSFRRAFVTLFRDGGASPDMCRSLVGHSSEEVERVYYRASLDKKQMYLANALSAVGLLAQTPASPVIPPAAPGDEYRRQA